MMTVSVPVYGPSGARGVVISSRAAATLDPTRFRGTAFERLLIAAETLAAELDDRQCLDMERTWLAMEQLDALVSSVDRDHLGVLSARCWAACASWRRARCSKPFNARRRARHEVVLRCPRKP